MFSSYEDREEGGRAIVEALRDRDLSQAIVVALGRGGLVTGSIVAEALGVPMIPLVVKRVRAPWDPDFALGAIAEDGTMVMDPRPEPQVDPQWQVDEQARARSEVARIRGEYGGTWPDLPLAGRTVLLIDDGLTTGHTLEAARIAVRNQSPAELIACVPIAARRSWLRIRDGFEEFISLQTGEALLHARHYYRHFPEIDEATGRAIINRCLRRPAPVV